jgi:uncharacterized protein YkwD
MPNKIVSMTQRQTANPSYTSHIIILLILSIIGVRLAIFHLGLHQTATASDLTVENIMAAINKERDLRNLALLKTDSRLTQAAQFKSDDMQARHYFSHTNPEGEYIWPKIVEYGYSPYVQLGENLAIEFYNTESLVSAWMNSPTHRANVLQENFKDQGMGLTFGDRQSNKYHSAITNTFGTLVASKTEPPKRAETKTPAPTQTPQVKPATQTPPKPEPVASTTPVVVKKTEPVYPKISFRSGEGETQRSFALPQKPLASSTPEPAQENSEVIQPDLQKAEPLPGTNNLKPRDFNRYVTLAFGFVVLLALFYDLREYWKNQKKHADKKLNNIILLALALLVIALFYWK